MGKGSWQNNHNLSPETLNWVVDATGICTKIQSVGRLKGATSSTLYRIEADYKGRDIKLVLRLFTKSEWLAAESDLALHEARSLKKAKEANVPVPELVAYDEYGEHCCVPAILMTYMPGSIDLKPAGLDDRLYNLADLLAAIHATEVGTYPWKYFCWNDPSCYRRPVWSKFPELWEKAIEIVLGPEPEEKECFLHRDYHPTNVLWQDKRISGIVDWVNACIGPASVDLSHCRANLQALYGVREADFFLKAYQAIVGGRFEHHPYWDLSTIVGNLPGPPDVYPPWVEFGVRDLNSKLLAERADEYLSSVMARL